MRAQQSVRPDSTYFHLAAAFTFVTIALGSMVCATDSSSSCPAWPVCYADRVGPQLQAGWLENPAIEFVHRAISFTALVLLAYAGWLGRHSHDRRLRVMPWVALVFAIGSAVFGMMIILFTLPLGLGLIDVGGALVAMTLITIAAEAASGRGAPAGAPRTRALAGGALGVLIVMHLSGIVVAGKTSNGTGSYTRCLSWPLWQVLELDRYDGLQVMRIGLAVLAAALVVAAVVTGLADPRLRGPAVSLGVLLAVELGLGLLIREQGLAVTQTNGINQTLAVAYSVTASALLWALGYLLGRTYAPPTEPTAEPTQPHDAHSAV